MEKISDADSLHSGQSKKKGASWLWLITTIIVLIIIGAAIAYFNHKNSASGLSALTNTAAKKPFSATDNSKVPVAITVNTRAQGDKTGNIALLQSDGKGNFKHTIFVNGKPFNTSFYTPDAYYACKNFSSPCLKYPRESASNSTFNPSGFIYDSALIKKIKGLATYQGQQKCPVGTGTCDVWSYDQKVNKRTYYVNTSNKNVVATKDNGHFGNTPITTNIAYDYKDQQFTVPTNYQNAPAESQ